MTTDDGKTRDFLGLPIFQRLYGFGDRLTLRAKMATAIFTGVDRAALAGALPRHPRVKLHGRSPLVMVQSDFLQCADNGDPLGNDYRYREVMLACVLEGVGPLYGPLFPLVLFLDDPIATAAGREFHGFPKVPAALTYGASGGRVEFTSSPHGERRTQRVMSTAWSVTPGLVARAMTAAGSALRKAVRAAGIDEDTVDGVVQLALAPAGETWNLHQVPDLVNPRRAAYSRLTRFKPVVVEPVDVTLLSGFTLDLPRAADEPTWALARRFFGAKEEALVKPATVAFRWEATMYAAGGEVIDAWLG